MFQTVGRFPIPAEPASSVLPQLKLEFVSDRVILWSEGGLDDDTIPTNVLRTGKSSAQEKAAVVKRYLIDKIPVSARREANQWNALTRHLADGRIPIDNNECEQLMKQVEPRRPSRDSP